MALAIRYHGEGKVVKIEIPVTFRTRGLVVALALVAATVYVTQSSSFAASFLLVVFMVIIATSIGGAIARSGKAGVAVGFLAVWIPTFIAPLIRLFTTIFVFAAFELMIFSFVLGAIGALIGGIAGYLTGRKWPADEAKQTLEMNTKSIVRAAGGGIILLSVFLTWLTALTGAFVEGRITLIFVDLSLGQMASDALTGIILGVPLETFAFTFITIALVVVGGIVSFKHSVGGIPVLAGTGYFFFYVSTQEVFVRFEAGIGIGMFVAIFGAVVVIAAAIPGLMKSGFHLGFHLGPIHLGPTSRKVGAVLVVAIVAAAGISGYAFLSGLGVLGGGSQDLVALESVTVMGDGRIRATWAVLNPRDQVLGLWNLDAKVEPVGGWPLAEGESVRVSRILSAGRFLSSADCVDIAPGENLVEQDLSVERNELAYPASELSSIGGWKPNGGRAFFHAADCATNSATGVREGDLCADIAGGGPFDFTCAGLPGVEPLG